MLKKGEILKLLTHKNEFDPDKIQKKSRLKKKISKQKIV